jgi:hypothetical protein
MIDQPGDQLAVVATEVVVAAELLGIVGTQLGVVAATPLGDVVEQPGQVEQLDLR